MQTQGHVLINSRTDAIRFHHEMTSNQNSLRQLSDKINLTCRTSVNEGVFIRQQAGFSISISAALHSSDVCRFFVGPSICQSVSAGLPQIGADQPTVRYSYQALGMRQPSNLFLDTRRVLYRTRIKSEIYAIRK